jgi:polyisoprenoid-binding protein YceI
MIAPIRTALLGLTLSLAAAAAAQAACPSGLPPQISCGLPDSSLAVAGAYNLDSKHAAVVAKVSHIGYSFSVFRFDKVKGSLTWDPATAAKSKLSVTVDTGSITTNVEGFSAELTSDGYLKSKAFPEATFVSTAFRQIDPTHGKVDGQFTLMGKTKPLTFDVELVGAGKGFGKPRIGVEATAQINPQDYGLPAMFVDPIHLVIDTEFEKAS